MYKELLSQRFVFKAPQSYCIGELLLVIQVKYKGIFAVIWFEKKITLTVIVWQLLRLCLHSPRLSILQQESEIMSFAQFHTMDIESFL